MADVEARAREMGWKPQEEFHGDPSRWVDAEAYVEELKKAKRYQRDVY